MTCDVLRSNDQPIVNRTNSHKFAVRFDGKMCVVPVRASAHRLNTAPYSPAARRRLALRGARPLPWLGAEAGARRT